MKALKVKDIYDACVKEIKAGHGDYAVMLSDDEEGNGYHYCWFEFTDAKYVVDKDCIYNSIAPIEKTIVLG